MTSPRRYTAVNDGEFQSMSSIERMTPQKRGRQGMSLVFISISCIQKMTFAQEAPSNVCWLFQTKSSAGRTASTGRYAAANDGEFQPTSSAERMTPQKRGRQGMSLVSQPMSSVKRTTIPAASVWSLRQHFNPRPSMRGWPRLGWTIMPASYGDFNPHPAHVGRLKDPKIKNNGKRLILIHISRAGDHIA